MGFLSARKAASDLKCNFSRMPASFSSASSFSRRRTSELADSSSALPSVKATSVNGLKLSGSLNVVIISKVGLHWARSSLEMYVRLLTSARFFWESPRVECLPISVRAKASVSEFQAYHRVDLASSNQFVRSSSAAIPLTLSPRASTRFAGKLKHPLWRNLSIMSFLWF